MTTRRRRRRSHFGSASAAHENSIHALAIHPPHPRSAFAHSHGCVDRGAFVQPATWGSVAFLIFVGGGAVIYYRYQQDKLQNTVRVETIGKPLLGGPFNLTDDSGQRVSSDTMKGKYVLLYFGTLATRSRFWLLFPSRPLTAYSCSSAVMSLSLLQASLTARTFARLNSRRWKRHSISSVSEQRGKQQRQTGVEQISSLEASAC